MKRKKGKKLNLVIKMSVYIVGFDLGEPLEIQCQQISYWLDYLNAALPLSTESDASLHQKWCIMLVGLRADLQKNRTFIQSKHISVWKQKYPQLSIMDNYFTVSAIYSKESVQQLLTKVESKCSQIFDKHAVQIPRSYRKILESFNSNPDNHILVPWKASGKL